MKGERRHATISLESWILVLIFLLNVNLSGEAEYINDIRAELDELFGVFVLTTVANGRIKNIDASQALVRKIILKGL